MSPRLLLIATVLALFTALVFAIFIAWSNAASRNLALATGALGGAMLLFLVQLPFELRGSTEKTFFTAEYTIDRQKPGIRQWRYKLGAARLGLPAETSRR